MCEQPKKPSIHLSKSPLILTALTCALMHAGYVNAQATMTDLGVLPRGDWSTATAVAANGSVIVGYSYDGPYLSYGQMRAFKYTVGGMVSLGTPTGGLFSSAMAVSADGSVIVGTAAPNATDNFTDWAHKYTSGGGWVLLTPPSGVPVNYSRGLGVSADGLVAVGFININDGTGRRAFKHNDSGGMVLLGTLPGGTSSYASAASSDGSVIVGASGIGTAGEDFAPGSGRAFKYTTSGGMVSLGVLSGPFASSAATAVSADGSVIVGASTSTNIISGAVIATAFKYTTSGGMVSLGAPLPGFTSSVANGVSADGSVIVGSSFNIPWYEPGSARAFIYTATGGMVSLGTLAGGTYSYANAVSADGSVIVGQADNASGGLRAFMYRNITSTPSSPGTTPPPLVDILNTYSAVAKQGYQLNSVL
ncbi:hypothetical protein ICN10_10020, partial [Polynucleobacter sp. 86C-FISCH]|nr:hypothetical protein [Polynucleobacter sp. 86C-FISCH]